jgi:hypothetical protein
VTYGRAPAGISSRAGPSDVAGCSDQDRPRSVDWYAVPPIATVTVVPAASRTGLCSYGSWRPWNGGASGVHVAPPSTVAATDTSHRWLPQARSSA